MHPTSLSPNEMSTLIALERMGPVSAEAAADVVAIFNGVAREVAAILLGVPEADYAGSEARGIARIIREVNDENRRRAAARGPLRSRVAMAG